MMALKIPLFSFFSVTCMISLDISEKLHLSPNLRFSQEQKHRELLDNVIEFGLNRNNPLVEVKEKELYDKGITLDKSQPFFVRVQQAAEKS